MQLPFILLYAEKKFGTWPGYTARMFLRRARVFSLGGWWGSEKAPALFGRDRKETQRRFFRQTEPKRSGLYKDETQDEFILPEHFNRRRAKRPAEAELKKKGMTYWSCLSFWWTVQDSNL